MLFLNILSFEEIKTLFNDDFYCDYIEENIL